MEKFANPGPLSRLLEDLLSPLRFATLLYDTFLYAFGEELTEELLEDLFNVKVLVPRDKNNLF